MQLDYSSLDYSTLDAPTAPVLYYIQINRNVEGIVCPLYQFLFFIVPPPPFFRVCVGWQRLCKTYQSLRAVDNQSTVVVFFGGHHDGYRVRLYCAG